MFSEDAVLTERTHARAHTDTHPKKKISLAKIYICMYKFIPLKPYQKCSQGLFFVFFHIYIPINRTRIEIPVFLR